MPSASSATPRSEKTALYSNVQPMMQEPVQEQSTAWRPLSIGAALGLLAAVVVGSAPSAMAADIENGEQVFGAICAACHAGGNNSVVAEKKLKKEALQTYGKYSVDAIKYQVTNGNGAMPAFGEKLSPEDIEDVANYVLGQANKGW